MHTYAYVYRCERVFSILRLVEAVCVCVPDAFELSERTISHILGESRVQD